jgi:hypothetical protein
MRAYACRRLINPAGKNKKKGKKQQFMLRAPAAGEG